MWVWNIQGKDTLIVGKFVCTFCILLFWWFGSSRWWRRDQGSNLTIFLTFLSANLTKWSNTPKQFVGKLLAICLIMFDHFVGLMLKGLSLTIKAIILNYLKSIELKQKNFFEKNLVISIFYNKKVIYFK